MHPVQNQQVFTIFYSFQNPLIVQNDGRNLFAVYALLWRILSFLVWRFYYADGRDLHFH